MQKTTIEALNIGEQQGTLIEAYYFKVKADDEPSYLYFSDNVLNINSKPPTSESIEISNKKTSSDSDSGSGIKMLFIILIFLITFAGLTRHLYLAWNEKNIYSDEKNKIIVEEIHKKEQEIKELKLKLHKE